MLLFLACTLLQKQDQIRLMLSESEPLPVHVQWAPVLDVDFGSGAQAEVFQEAIESRVCHEEQGYGVEDFEAFLPENAVPLGAVWSLQFSELAPFLRQIHDGARADGPGRSGGYACLRAVSPAFAEVLFRVQVNFALDGGRGWMVPALLQGRVLFARTSERVRSFEMWLPDERPNVLLKAGGFQRLGYVPRMRWLGGDPPTPKEIAWRGQIPAAEAWQKLAHGFYGALDLDWPSLEQVAPDRPLLVLVLPAPLENECCFGTARVLREQALGDARVGEFLRQHLERTRVLAASLAELPRSLDSTRARALAERIRTDAAGSGDTLAPCALLYSAERKLLARRTLEDLAPEHPDPPVDVAAGFLQWLQDALPGG